jgi:APA family basic amino acid/polyamine antiporter
MPSPLFATKSVDDLRADAEHTHGLKRTLSATDLVLLGIGAIIGTGIFVLTGHAAAVNAGPAVALSFVVAGLAAVFAGLCYAEMASMIPISGSAYTYAYATMGELTAWIIGWDLIIEYLVAAATVSVGWSGYAVAFFQHVTGATLPADFTSAPVAWVQANNFWGGHFVTTGHVMNLPAAIIVMLVTIVLIVGIKESARFNSVIVFVKLAVVLAFIGFAAPHVNLANWEPFIPPNTGIDGEFGWSGIFRGAILVFFAYIGFDAVSTAAQETKNPQRSLPIGILVSLAICTILYIAVALVLTGVVHYTELNVPHPISVGIAATGARWLSLMVEIGAIAGLTSVMLVMLLGQSRIFFTMALDGLVPGAATRIHPRFGTPYVTTILTGIGCAAAGSVVPIGVLAELVSIGTLFAFLIVSVGVMVLRRKRPDIPRAFRVPGGPYLVPGLGVLCCVGLMAQSSRATIMRLFVWLSLGLLIYARYGRKHSRLRARNLNAPG